MNRVSLFFMAKHRESYRYSEEYCLVFFFFSLFDSKEYCLVLLLVVAFSFVPIVLYE